MNPTRAEEVQLYSQGVELVAGVDEVGRGALAGPVVAGAVIFASSLKAPWERLVRDSQELRPRQREGLVGLIRGEALAWGLGEVPAQEIDQIGILPATRQAMRQALEALGVSPQFLLIDGIKLPEVNLPQKRLIRGDKLCFSIACASIVAKVYRDGLMVGLDREYPGYGFARHKGYGTAHHQQCLLKRGPCPLHRRSFAPLRPL